MCMILQWGLFFFPDGEQAVRASNFPAGDVEVSEFRSLRVRHECVAWL
jgi:hypothetical protein